MQFLYCLFARRIRRLILKHNINTLVSIHNDPVDQLRHDLSRHLFQFSILHKLIYPVLIAFFCSAKVFFFLFCLPDLFPLPL